MAAGTQKQKLLVMKKYFETNTDENHRVTGNQLIEYLTNLGIKAERKTIYDDIKTLVDSGMDIETNKEGHSNTYYLRERNFMDVELLILADAVASSRFLSVSKSNQLIKKLQKLTSKYKAPGLKRCIHVARRPKSFNDKIYYAINEIHSAISQNKQLTFEYMEYTPEKKLVAKHGGARYQVSPHSLVWEDDKYYLTCYCHKHEKICHYRVDRMKNVRVSDEDCIEFSDEQREEAENLTPVFRMYSGEVRTVTMEFDNSLVNTVIDKFGVDVHMRKISEEKFSITADIQVSPTFFGWLFQFGNKAKIVSPDEVAQEAKDFLETIAGQYK